MLGSSSESRFPLSERAYEKIIPAVPGWEGTGASGRRPSARGRRAEGNPSPSPGPQTAQPSTRGSASAAAAARL